MLSFIEIHRVEEHSEADIELKATAFSTHKINRPSQLMKLATNQIEKYQNNIETENLII